MKLFSNDLILKKKNIVSNLPDGADCLAAAELCDHFSKILIILRDDVRLSRFSQSLRIITNNIDIIEFPAWDCLPFDKNSPNQKLVGKRVRALSSLANPNSKKTIILSTIGSVIQKIPNQDFIKNSSKSIQSGQNISQRELINFFENNGYMRTNTVREDSEYSFRGSILDVYPPGEKHPVRIDFFGDVIDSLRVFDPISQLSLHNINFISFNAGNEIILTDHSVELFRRNHRELFNEEYDKSLYSNISQKIRTNGIEHYLSMFHESLATIFDHIGDVHVILDKEHSPILDTKFEEINDFYNARKDDYNIEGKRFNLLSPQHLYIDKKKLLEILDKRVVIEFNSFTSGEKNSSIYLNIKPGIDFSIAKIQGENTVKELLTLTEIHSRILVCCNSNGSLQRIKGIINGIAKDDIINEIKNISQLKDNFSCIVYPLEKGFKINNTLFVSEEDLFGVKFGRPTVKSKKAENFLRDITSLTTGDLLVHVEHGIGKYEGLETIKSNDLERDCLKLLYSGNDRLYVPVENIELISRYGSGTDASLDKLGSSGWQARKANAKKRIKEIADELIKVAASRETTKIKPLEFPSDEYERFCSRFSYTPTEDQQLAIQDVENDLLSGRLMDRLICGDVGYGKTEIALRSSFMAAMAGYQVAVIAPTTLLVKQHVVNFQERFRGFPIKVSELSRFVKSKDSKLVKHEIETGETQIIIGTHSLLSKKIVFNNLLLLIIDEEQHFGVAQKEYLKSIRQSMHVLTLTATPIPRTLQMSLSGVRTMSLITTPPVDRLSIRTFVSTWDNVTLKEAIKREIHRGGLVFCVVPRIKDLNKVHDKLIELLPDLKIATAHGRMSVEEIDKSMIGFSQGKANILLSTNIIESGLDIPLANTIIVYNADKFGLSQLYQLRGRVGRGKARAYAYLIINDDSLLTNNARKRLEVMQTLDNLGAGFSLASYDMDIRGAGNLLGEEQSGHIKEVGIELYQSLLKAAIEINSVEGNLNINEWSPQIQIGVSSKIPESYIEDVSLRLSMYRRIAVLKSEEEIEIIKQELVDRFGNLPKEVSTLLEIINIKQYCKNTNVYKIDAGKNGINLKFYNDIFPKPENLLKYITKNSERILVNSDQSIIIKKNMSNKNERIRLVKEELKMISDLLI